MIRKLLLSAILVLTIVKPVEATVINDPKTLLKEPERLVQLGDELEEKTGYFLYVHIDPVYSDDKILKDTTESIHLIMRTNQLQPSTGTPISLSYVANNNSPFLLNGKGKQNLSSVFEENKVNGLDLAIHATLQKMSDMHSDKDFNKYHSLLAVDWGNLLTKAFFTIILGILALVVIIFIFFSVVPK